MKKIAIAITVLFVSIISSVYFHSNTLDMGWDGSDEPTYNIQLGPEAKSDSVPQIFLNRLNPKDQGGWFYRPTFTARYATTLKYFGENPRIFHLENLVLHGMALGLMMIFIFLILHKEIEWIYRAGIAGLSGLGFFIASARSETIWWISAGSTQEAAMWSLAVLIAWTLKHYETDKRIIAGLYAFSLVAFWLALGAKQEAFFLPIGLIAIDRYLHTAKWNIFRKEVWPFVGLTIIALVCNLIAYRWNGDHFGTAQTTVVNTSYFHFNDISSRLNVTLMFLNNLSGDLFAAYWAIALAGMISVWFIVKNKTLRLFWIITVIAGMIPPLQAGNHALNNSRLYYLPSMFAIPFLIMAFTYLLCSETRRNRILAILGAVTILPIPYLGYVRFNDPLVIIGILLVFVAAAAWMMKDKELSPKLGFLVILIAIGSQLTIFLPLPFIWGWQLIAIAAGAWLLGWQGVLIASIGWASPIICLPIILGLGYRKNPDHVEVPEEKELDNTPLLVFPRLPQFQKAA